MRNWAMTPTNDGTIVDESEGAKRRLVCQVIGHGTSFGKQVETALTTLPKFVKAVIVLLDQFETVCRWNGVTASQKDALLAVTDMLPIFGVTQEKQMEVSPTMRDLLKFVARSGSVPPTLTAVNAQWESILPNALNSEWLQIKKEPKNIEGMKCIVDYVVLTEAGNRVLKAPKTHQNAGERAPSLLYHVNVLMSISLQIQEAHLRKDEFRLKELLKARSEYFDACPETLRDKLDDMMGEISNALAGLEDEE